MLRVLWNSSGTFSHTLMPMVFVICFGVYGLNARLFLHQTDPTGQRPYLLNHWCVLRVSWSMQKVLNNAQQVSDWGWERNMKGEEGGRAAG